MGGAPQSADVPCAVRSWPNCPQPARCLDLLAVSIAAAGVYRVIQGGCSSLTSPRASPVLFQGFCVQLPGRNTSSVVSLFYVVVFFTQVTPSVPFVANVSLGCWRAVGVSSSTGIVLVCHPLYVNLWYARSPPRYVTRFSTCVVVAPGFSYASGV